MPVADVVKAVYCSQYGRATTPEREVKASDAIMQSQTQSNSLLRERAIESEHQLLIQLGFALNVEQPHELLLSAKSSLHEHVSFPSPSSPPLPSSHESVNNVYGYASELCAQCFVDPMCIQFSAGTLAASALIVSLKVIRGSCLSVDRWQYWLHNHCCLSDWQLHDVRQAIQQLCDIVLSAKDEDIWGVLFGGSGRISRPLCEQLVYELEYQAPSVNETYLLNGDDMEVKHGVNKRTRTGMDWSEKAMKSLKDASRASDGSIEPGEVLNRESRLQRDGTSGYADDVRIGPASPVRPPQHHRVDDGKRNSEPSHSKRRGEPNYKERDRFERKHEEEVHQPYKSHRRDRSPRDKFPSPARDDRERHLHRDERERQSRKDRKGRSHSRSRSRSRSRDRHRNRERSKMQ